MFIDVALTEKPFFVFACLDNILEESVYFKSLQDIKAQDFILTPGRYVGIAEQEDDGEPFAEKMQRLTSELSGLFKESHRLEDEIKKQLGSIGFGIE